MYRRKDRGRKRRNYNVSAADSSSVHIFIAQSTIFAYMCPSSWNHLPLELLSLPPPLFRKRLKTILFVGDSSDLSRERPSTATRLNEHCEAHSLCPMVLTWAAFSLMAYIVYRPIPRQIKYWRFINIAGQNLQSAGEERGVNSFVATLVSGLCKSTS